MFIKRKQYILIYQLNNIYYLLKFSNLKRNQDKYLVGKKLGQGKFSDVYLGYDQTKSNQAVVIKILKPTTENKLFKEINILKHINQVKNIAHLLDVTEDPQLKVPCLIFEYIKGVNLNQVLNKLNYDLVKYYSYLLLEAVSESHNVGIFHRDIKGLNIIVNIKQRKFNLIDWGVSDFYYSFEKILNKVGTIHTKSPEMVLRESFKYFFTPAIDVWSAGAVIYSMAERISANEALQHNFFDDIRNQIIKKDIQE
ncbi:hypothetical protein IMG5_196960 [Ichthyophthirius multifiliis]|uniref:non-specific serine/threonine protein kinase n=1 Tax=Ichthyophthirius multifiliis TaxID=5932 RepID=G0R584_ICHMU|nr:hypothetical protein IMG5_196960 [Ichthyophthirius multifiliis]EGR27361.1 hypothetical protein IMG5_196960 [Ichthyophthirius multifiliis]|eukprot:XP_004024245.1 hypothetical protein IMG5_196960 [Ichthyophthirius multifiliis]